MTKTNTLADIAGEIETLSADLLKVNATIDLLGKSAIDAANKIDKALKDAKDRFATALADQATADRNKRLSSFSDIQVTVRPGDNLISTGFVIRYTKDAWDMSVNAVVPKPHECNGFAALADDAYEYLVTKKPENIPAVIMALAPGKPQEAISAYLAGKARGYFKGGSVSA
ncbi:hypothetical protein [Blastomonas sp.]|uniref:hypothetical protein n=1 Tax=Blastomonas sp. TaxID=1909299 RepID=UPI00391AEA91